MNILIYGGGAVGLGIASCLLKAGEKVDIVARKETVLSLKKSGLHRDGIFSNYSKDPVGFGAYINLHEIKESRYEYICVCTKSFDSQSAAEDISKYKHLYNPNGKIVLFQNGWGNTEIFFKYYPEEIIYSARVITGFTRPSPNKVTITVHADNIHIGHLKPGDRHLKVKNLAEAIGAGGIPCKTVDNIAKDLWAKMLYNCPLNPLGAIVKVPYGELGKKKSSRLIMDEIINEVFAVMTAAGYTTHWSNAEGFKEIFYKKQIPLTAEHKSSTLQDLYAGKRIEIDALNGAVIKLGEKYKVPVPANKIIYNMIQFIASNQSK